MIRAPVARYIRYWYTYRTAVAVILAVVLSGAIYWLYTQQVACDTHAGACVLKVSLHPEDRLMGYGKPDPSVVIVGIDNQSVKTIDHYPVRRDEYALALKTLEKAGAAVVAFDIGFPDPRDAATDAKFTDALAASKIPVILAYGGDNIRVADGMLVQEGIDQIPLRQFRCSDWRATSASARAGSSLISGLRRSSSWRRWKRLRGSSRERF